MWGLCSGKKWILSQLGAEKFAFLPKSDRGTDISNYRVASLLKAQQIRPTILKTIDCIRNI